MRASPEGACSRALVNMVVLVTKVVLVDLATLVDLEAGWEEASSDSPLLTLSFQVLQDLLDFLTAKHHPNPFRCWWSWGWRKARESATMPNSQLPGRQTSRPTRRLEGADRMGSPLQQWHFDQGALRVRHLEGHLGSTEARSWWLRRHEDPTNLDAGLKVGKTLLAAEENPRQDRL